MRDHNLSVLGSTGSIGTQTLDVARRHADKLEVVALAAGTRAEELLALVASVFDAYSVVLFQPEDETGKSEARLTAFFSLGDEIARGARIPPGKGLVGWILRNKAPLLVDSIDQNQAFLGYYQEQSEPDIRSFMGCPVPGGGALCIDSVGSYPGASCW